MGESLLVPLPVSQLYARLGETPLFERWYYTVNRLPMLQSQTPVQMRRSTSIVHLDAGLRLRILVGRLPITAVQIHFMCKVEATGNIKVLNEPW